MTSPRQPDAWHGGRIPHDDPTREAARTQVYWSWLDSQPVRPTDARVLAQDGALTWIALISSDQADFEASHMRHSIGHSFGKYSAMGRLYSLRAPGGAPVATVLEVSGRIVHAREHHNARLGVEAQSCLERFAGRMGFEILQDKLPFDVRPDNAMPNTELRLCQREGLQAKAVAQLVLPGVLDAEEAEVLAQRLGGNCLDLEGAGLRSLVGLSGAEVEIIALVAADEIPGDGAPDLSSLIRRIDAGDPALGC